MTTADTRQHLSLVAQPLLGELEMTDIADVANHAVERIVRLEDELQPLQSQLDHLANWAAKQGHDWHEEFFSDLAAAVEALRNCVPDVVCDLGLQRS
jgi:hypothetical protein